MYTLNTYNHNTTTLPYAENTLKTLPFNVYNEYQYISLGTWYCPMLPGLWESSHPEVKIRSGRPCRVAMANLDLFSEATGKKNCYQQGIQPHRFSLYTSAKPSQLVVFLA